MDEQHLLASGDYQLVADVALPPDPSPAGCGAAALAAVLGRAAPGLDAAVLDSALPRPDGGATPVDLLLAARDLGFEARIARGRWADLAAGVADARPPLVMFDAAPAVWTPLGAVRTPRRMHWSAVTGVARDGSRLLLAAGRGRHHVVGRDEFLKRWSAAACCLIEVAVPAAGIPRAALQGDAAVATSGG